MFFGLDDMDLYLEFFDIKIELILLYYIKLYLIFVMKEIIYGFVLKYGERLFYYFF